MGVRTDRTFERDENTNFLILLTTNLWCELTGLLNGMKTLIFQAVDGTSGGANWPDFWTGWKHLALVMLDSPTKVRTDRTFERDENIKALRIWSAALEVRTDRTFERDENTLHICLVEGLYLVRTDRTFERDENKINQFLYYRLYRCELTGLLNGMKTIELPLIAKCFMVRTDRTFERDENFRSSFSFANNSRVRTDRTFERDENKLWVDNAVHFVKGANWPDFWTGWKLFMFDGIVEILPVRTDRTFERDENTRGKTGTKPLRGCELTGLLNGMKTLCPT